MNKLFRKYKFQSEAAAKAAIASLGVDEEGNATHSHLIVELGHEVTTPATYDEEGEILTESVLGDAYLVDCLWSGEPVEAWASNVVWCASFGMLVMGASEVRREWLNQCKIERPELFPEPSDDDVVA